MPMAPSTSSILAMTELIERLLIREEGLRLDPYRDHLGFWTIGYGCLIDRRRGGKLPSWIEPSFPITELEALELLRNEVAENTVALEDALPRFTSLDDVRRTVLLSMAFQMGMGGLLKFVHTLAAVEAGRWGDAANGIRGSKWYTQTTARAERLAVAMLTGDEAAFKLNGGSDA